MNTTPPTIIPEQVKKKVKYIDKLLWFAVAVAIGSIGSWSVMQDDHETSINKLQMQLQNRENEHKEMTGEITDLLNLTNALAERCLCENKVIDCDIVEVNGKLREIYLTIKEHTKG